MKSNTKTAILFSLMICFISLKGFSQNKTDTTLLIGSWAFNYDASLSNMTARTKAHHNEISQAQRSKIKEKYSGNKLSFSQDKSFLLTTTSGKTLSGLWRFDETTQQLELTMDNNGKKKIWLLSKLNKNQLILKSIDTGDAVPFFAESHYRKI